MKEYFAKIFKMFKATLLTVLVASIGVLLYFYFASYSEGYRAGIVYKLSKKGVLFKTYEGEMNTGNYYAAKDDDNQNLTTKVWAFSVDDDQHEVIKKLEQAVMTGERVKLFYKERYFKLPWRGDTRYFIIDVKSE